MKKRGQVAVFIITGIIIIIILEFGYYSFFYSAKSKASEAAAKSQAGNYGDAVKAYAESCLKLIIDDALLARIGPQAGFIDTEGEEGVIGSPISPPYITFIRDKVPFYLAASGCTEVCAEDFPGCIKNKCEWSYQTYPANPGTFMDDVSHKISRYVEAEFLNCFSKNTFKDIGILISPQAQVPNAETKINNEDVAVKINYPLTVKKGGSELRLDSFQTSVPIRLRALYELSEKLVRKISSIAQTDESVQVTYNLNLDCPDYYDEGLTNVYVSTAGDGSKVVKFSDYSAYYKGYINPYKFQVAIKNVDIKGSCVG